MPRNKFTVVETESENEQEEGVLGEDVSHDLGAPFPVFEAEVAHYENICKRKIKTPVYIEMDKWMAKKEEGDEFASRLVGFIQRLRLDKWAGVKMNAYPQLMREFYTTCSFDRDGTLECRFGGVECKFSVQDIMEAFGFYAKGGWKLGGKPDRNGLYPKRDEAYFEEEFWDKIKCKGIGPTSGFPIGALQDNAAYYGFKYVTLGAWGKAESSRISSDELYFLWNVLKDGWDVDMARLGEENPINIYPYILATLKQVLYTKKNLNSPLSLGSMITVLALSKKWTPGEKEKKIVPRVLPCGDRLLRTPLRPLGKLVPISILRDPDANEDEGYVPNAPIENPSKGDERAENVAQPDYSEAQPAYDTARPDRSEAQPVFPGLDFPSWPDQPESSTGPMFPTPLVFDIPLTRKARTKKDRSRPGKEVPPSPPRVARVSFDGPTRKEFDTMLGEMRANHRATMERQERVEAKIDRYLEEDRAWKKEMREDIKFLLFREGFEDDFLENEAVARDQDGEP